MSFQLKNLGATHRHPLRASYWGLYFGRYINMRICARTPTKLASPPKTLYLHNRLVVNLIATQVRYFYAHSELYYTDVIILRVVP